MTDTLVKKYEQFLQEQLGDALAELPAETVIPLSYEDEQGGEEVVFIAKCRPEQYEALTKLPADETLPFSVTMNMTPSEFTFGIVLTELELQAVLTLDSAEALLRTLYGQDVFKYFIFDEQTLKLVWLTTNVRFDQLRHHYGPIFQFFGIPDSQYKDKLRVVVIPPGQGGYVEYLPADAAERSRQVQRLIGGEVAAHSNSSIVVLKNAQDESASPAPGGRLVDNKHPFIVAGKQDSSLRGLTIQETMAALSSFSGQ